ncbi:MAG: hypothetical protein AAFN93_07210 [Bacteroidota bacterium]
MSTKTLFFLTIILSICVRLNAQKELVYHYDAQGEYVNYPHFWKSTGYDPASITTKSDFRLYLNMVKALRGGAIEYIRPHFLLNHVQIINPGTVEQSYNWQELDKILDVLVQADLKLIFEIMMSPHPYFNDWYDRHKLISWKDFCKTLIIHLQERYGEATVRSWYFESINEPDISYWWPYGPLQFLYYYDATSQGILEADPKIKFGGPGAAYGRSAVYEIFIDHVHNGINFYTGNKDVRCDFITWHRKSTPHQMVEMENQVDDFIDGYKNEEMSKIPIGNDEADPIAGWSKPFWWRPLPWYASFIAQSVDLHNRNFVDEKEKDYFVLSNDNAFLGDWYARTQVARFSSQNDSTDNGFYLIKKPVMNVMSLLGMQGNQRLRSEQSASDSTAGSIVSKNYDGEYFILSYNKPEIEVSYEAGGEEPNEAAQKARINQPKTITTHLKNIPQGKYTIIKYRLDDQNGNPFSIWLKDGKVQKPTTSQIKVLQEHENATLTLEKEMMITSEYNTKSDFAMSGVELLYLAQKPGARPNTVTNLSFNLYEGLNKEKMVMLNWDHNDEKHIQTFEVYYAPRGTKKFTKANSYDIMDNGFLHIEQGQTGGRYKVVAVDYWGRKSKASEILNVNLN